LIPTHHYVSIFAGHAQSCFHACAETAWCMHLRTRGRPTGAASIALLRTRLSLPGARHRIQLRAPLSPVGSPDEFPNMLLSQLVNVDSNLLAPCGFLQHDPNERPESVLFVRVPGQPSIPVNISRRKTERYGSSSKPSSSRPDEYPRKALHSRHNKVWVLYTRAITGTQRVSSEFWLFLQH
jgi:hypothetical protein